MSVGALRTLTAVAAAGMWAAWAVVGAVTATAAVAPPTTDLQTAVAGVVVVSTVTGHGSGFAVSEDRIVTAAHVVEGATDVRIEAAGDELAGTVVARDGRLDLAVVSVPGHGLPVLQVREGTPGLGETAYAVGAPLDEGIRLTRGVVSGFSTSDGVEHIQTDAAVNPGNSGGPLLDEQGRVIGVVVSKVAEVDVEGVGYAVPAEHAVRLAGSTGSGAPDSGPGATAGAPPGSGTDPSDGAGSAAGRGTALAALALVAFAGLTAVVTRARTSRRRRPASPPAKPYPSPRTWVPLATHGPAAVEPVEVTLLSRPGGPGVQIPDWSGTASAR